MNGEIVDSGCSTKRMRINRALIRGIAVVEGTKFTKNRAYLTDFRAFLSDLVCKENELASICRRCEIVSIGRRETCFIDRKDPKPVSGTREYLVSEEGLSEKDFRILAKKVRSETSGLWTSGIDRVAVYFLLKSRCFDSQFRHRVGITAIDRTSRKDTVIVVLIDGERKVIDITGSERPTKRKKPVGGIGVSKGEGVKANASVTKSAGVSKTTFREVVTFTENTNDGASRQGPGFE